MNVCKTKALTNMRASGNADDDEVMIDDDDEVMKMVMRMK